MKKVSSILGATPVMILSLSACGNSAPAKESQEVLSAELKKVELTTNSGPILVLESESVATFKGIPYAKPPVGELRFAPPEDVESWTETLNCEDFGPTAMQVTPIGDYPMSEDCLTLNVWKPADAKEGEVYPRRRLCHRRNRRAFL